MAQEAGKLVHPRILASISNPNLILCPGRDQGWKFPLPRGGLCSLTRHQQVMHFISPKGGTAGCQLSLCVYHCRPNLQALGPSACIMSENAAGLFSEAVDKGRGGGPEKMEKSMDGTDAAKHSLAKH